MNKNKNLHERAKLRSLKKTTRPIDFAKMRRYFPNRVNIVAEGDSWFAYPPKWPFMKPPNLVSHISSATRGKANFLDMASNGDEAVDMVSGPEKHNLVKILRWHQQAKNRKPVDILLFSGGGNDVVGKNDFERFIRQPYMKKYKTGKQCVDTVRLNRKAKQIGLAYEELLDIRDHYSPETLVITHTYDYPYPSLQGAEFLGGLIKTKAWMKRFMDEAGIPNELQTDVIKVFMDTMASELLKIATKRKRFVVVDSRGTLEGKKEWLNEIHPTSNGFKQIADLIHAEMKNAFPALRDKNNQTGQSATS